MVGEQHRAAFQAFGAGDGVLDRLDLEEEVGAVVMGAASSTVLDCTSPLADCVEGFFQGVSQGAAEEGVIEAIFRDIPDVPSAIVSGAVKNPNMYEVPRNEPVTVLKAITLAGGTTDRAAEKRVQIMRTDENGVRVAFQVDLRKIKRGKAEDPILQRDDIVLVPEAFF